MTHEKLLKLTKEQEAFLQECDLEFSNRYTSSDPEYQSIFERNLPPPPIIENWTSRRGNFNNYNHNRNRNFRGRHTRDDEGNYGGHSRNENRYDRPHYNESNNQNYSNKRQRTYY
ncbi:RNA guanine-N7 methyltransferase activating subunit [Chrysoperla carnea]|uniref:RNA guanine-N7 methyltransferase activating subunit n=1 Tax=Chrysoperla carnea TaxID=189513 RepID=UPI001D08FD4F|nr:RNA guanine-N7 methyltransferase activating subunit [Chrysoperla carnea]